MDFYKDFPERSDAGTATTPDGGIVAGNDKLNDNDYTMVGANGTGSNSQGKGYKVKFSSIYNYLKGKLLGDSGMEATSERRGLMSLYDKQKLNAYIGVDVIDGQYNKVIDKKVFSGYNYGTSVYLLLTECVSSSGFSGTVIGLHNNDNTDYGNNANITLSYNYGNSANINKHIGQRNSSSRLAYQGVVKIKYDNKFYIALKFIGGTGALTVFVNGFASKNGTAFIFVGGAYCSEELILVNNTTTITGSPTTLAASYISERYSLDEEQALTRRMIANDPTVVEQFEAYNAYCEECKAKAKEELANQPQVLPADSLDAQQ